VVAILPYPSQHRCKDQVVKGLGDLLPVPTEWSTGDQALQRIQSDPAKAHVGSTLHTYAEILDKIRILKDLPLHRTIIQILIYIKYITIQHEV